MLRLPHLALRYLATVGLMTMDAPADGEDIGPYAILTDIQGTEDHYGDMDFKVAGTAAGITAMQARVTCFLSTVVCWVRFSCLVVMLPYSGGCVATVAGVRYRC